MEPTLTKLRLHLDSITSFLTPLLPLVNCHMVEFFTQDHWERFLPKPLRDQLEEMELDDAVSQFHQAVEKPNTCNTELNKWVENAQAHCVTINNEYCLSVDQLKKKIEKWGGKMRPEIKVKEFMTTKKSYEVQKMSNLVASLHSTLSTSCCVEAGGGRGYLPVALCLGYQVPSLTVDCDQKTLQAAEERVKVIQKQWHAIAKRIQDGREQNVTVNARKDLHRFAHAFVTKHTDLTAIVKSKFPEMDGDVKLLLTGLHTCGNLGPDSLRIFTTQDHIRAVFNVPCCYHLLTENIDVQYFDVFQRDYGGGDEKNEGFPMSEHLRGYNLGRNARMLAAQSIDRVVSLRQLPPKSLLYRALLQVLIKQHLPDHVLSEGKLKRISSQNDFKSYFRSADAILDLGLTGRLSDSCLTDLSRDSDRWKRLVVFYLLRLCLAQVIEGVILLDRLLFLYENGFSDVFLVKLFDPVLSPRCHSIVAVR